MMKKYFILITTIILITNCSYYSFSGASIPKHLENVQVLTFENMTQRFDLSLSDRITEGIIKYIEDYNLIDIENSPDTDSRIWGEIRRYEEKVVSQTQDEIADQRSIQMTINISFFDKINKKPIIDNVAITETEYYNESDGDEGKEEALNDLIDKISEKAVIKLSSNW